MRILFPLLLSCTLLNTFAQTTKEQDNVLFSYELQKSEDGKNDRYTVQLRAENRNDFDVYYSGPVTASLSSASSNGFVQLKVTNNTGFMATNVSYLKGLPTSMYINTNEILYKLDRGKIVTGDFSFKVKKGVTPSILTMFTSGLKPLNYYNVKPTGSTAGNALDAGQSLRSNDRLTSQNGQYYLLMQDDGNLCVYRKSYSNDAFVWGTMTNGKYATSLRMQEDGNLVLYTNSNSPVWSSNTTPYFDTKYNNSTNKPVKLVLENDGRLVLYSITGKDVWNSSGKKRSYSSIPKPFPQAKFPMTSYDETGSVLPSPRSLGINECLSSENQEYYLVLQDDGHLCIYRRASNNKHKFVWGTNTPGKGANKLMMQNDGNLVLYASGNVSVWATETMKSFDRKYGTAEYKPVRAVLENDGKLVLYSQTGNRVWSSQ